MEKIIFYVDGACRTNPGPGAYAVLRIFPSELIYTEFFAHTTNNRMELCAVIKAIELSNEYTNKTIVIIKSDSQYVVSGYNNWIYKWQKDNWKKSDKKAIENLDLWQYLWSLKKDNFIIEWVKAHHVDVYNNQVDLLARNAIL